MSIWVDIHKRSTGKTVRKEDYINITDFANLPEGEERDIKDCLESTYDALRHCDMLSINDRVGTSVELSEKKKTYYELLEERELLPENEDDRKKIMTIRVLGEYSKDNGTIILYINNIKDTADGQKAPEFNGKPYLTVTRYVYLHELMHAFFDKGKDGYKYNRGEEEGLAEFGALLLLDHLPDGTKIPAGNHASKEGLEWAIRHVERKTGALECYSRGAYLFKLFGADKDLSKRMLKAYPKPVE